jgi:hypothetical protein
MEHHELTELQYSHDRKGPFRLYIYEPNSECHCGGIWFQRVPQYPEEGEISCAEAMVLALEAQSAGREVRICDAGDMLVYHQKGGKILYPQPIGNFWSEITA